MANLFPPTIVNSYRNSNTVLQATTLESSNGPLNNMFNLQTLRTVKGRVDLTGTLPVSSTFVVINEYDGSPVKLNSGDIILALTLANGNPALPNSVQTNSQSYPNPFSAGTVQFELATAPTYSPGTGLWSPSNTAIDRAITSAITLTTSLGSTLTSQTSALSPLIFNTQVGGLNSGVSSQSGSYNWLNCIASSVNITALTSGSQTPSINVTLLVLNPTTSV
jgi:hypothetical protein